MKLLLKTKTGTAMTLGHLERSLHFTKLLGSPQEYRQALLLYAKIVDEGLKVKRVKELFACTITNGHETRLKSIMRKFKELAVLAPLVWCQLVFIESWCSS